VNEQTTVELSKVDTGKKPSGSRVAKVWRGVSGSLAAGLVLLALAVIAVQVYAGNQGLPGPGTYVVVGHCVAAVLAVLGQRFADRLTGWLAALASLAVVVIAAATLWIFWWA
jgi:hypothetical protein